MSDTGERVLVLAEGWIGTPYRHQASLKGVGCDCLGLISGIWRDLYGHEPELPPPYAPDWAERGGEDRLMAAAKRHFPAVAGLEEARPGDL
ncbi:MAG: peptidase P60, partial [Stutzerimonas stutzeri]